jgi:23S rRNA pseudouridine1911/1915/1917 synthase
VTRSDPQSRRPERRRLARVVQELHPELSFSRAKRAIDAGQVEVDGATVRDPGALVEPAATVVWRRDRPATPAGAIRVELVHHDGDIAVAIKPAGLLTVPTPAREKDTMLSRVALAVARREGSRPFLAVVHRLDRDTSGLVVFAASRPALASLQAQLLDRTMGRQYTAVVAGEMSADAGTFDRALIGDGLRRRRWVTRAGETGKPAVTHWRVVERFAGATRVEVALETGRTHQIRIHFAAAGHPVLGEPVYRAPGIEPPPAAIGRQALHAGRLSFTHPRDRRPLVFEAPLPADLERLLAELRRGRIVP